MEETRKNGTKLVKLGIQTYHIPNVKEASKNPLSNNNNAQSITKYGVLGWLDVHHCRFCVVRATYVPCHEQQF